jgi:aldehyde dehydrogenase (NAD+)
MHSPGWLERALAFRYPPFKTKETPKTLKPKANFKRGENINDQRRRSSSLAKGVNVAAAIAVVGTLYYYFYH